MMRCVFCSLLLLTMVTPSQAEDETDSSTIRVMSFNVRYNNPRDGQNAWPLRKDWVPEVVKNAKADLIGFQEVTHGQLKDLQQRLPGYGFYGVGRTDGKTKGEYVPVFYREDRFKPLSSGTFWLSKTPEQPGSKDWDAAITRIACWVKLEEKSSQRTFIMINTHFDHVGKEAREQSAFQIVAWIEKHTANQPVVLTGDFNTLPGSDPYEVLVGNQKLRDTPGSDLRDTRKKSQSKPTGPNSTWNGFKAIQPNRIIDFIFCTSQWDVMAHRHIDEQKDGRFPSDHLPLITTLKLEPVAEEE